MNRTLELDALLDALAHGCCRAQLQLARRHQQQQATLPAALAELVSVRRHFITALDVALAVAPQWLHVGGRKRLGLRVVAGPGPHRVDIRLRFVPNTRIDVYLDDELLRRVSVAIEAIVGGGGDASDDPLHRSSLGHAAWLLLADDDALPAASILRAHA